MSEKQCEFCGEIIMWMQTRDKKNIPVNIPPFENGELDNEYVITSQEYNPELMQSHFATCNKSKIYAQTIKKIKEVL